MIPTSHHTQKIEKRSKYEKPNFKRFRKEEWIINEAEEMCLKQGIKSTIHKEKNDTFNYIKILNVCTTNDIMNKVL